MKTIGEAGRADEGAPALAPTLAKAVQTVTAVVDGCTHAGVSTVERSGAVTTAAETSPYVGIVDAAQTGDRTGPAVTMLEAELLSSPDLTTEARWWSWARTVVEETPFRSLLAVRISATRRRVAVLSCYSEQAHAFTGPALDRARATADLLALTMRHAEATAELHEAAVSKAVVGRAVGILMERFDLDAERALAVLRRISSNTNRRMTDLAEEITATRRLPEVPSHQSVDARPSIT